MAQTLIRHSKVLEIVGDIMRVYVPEETKSSRIAPRFGDLGIVEDTDGRESLAQVIGINRDVG